MRFDFTVNDLSLWLMLILMIWVWLDRSLYSATKENSEVISFNPSEEEKLKNCFPNSVYGFRNLEYGARHIYCFGKLRSRNLKYTYELVNRNIQEAFGDRFICYLQEMPMMQSNVYIGHSLVDDFDRESSLPNYCFCLQVKEIVDRIDNQLTQKIVNWRILSLVSFVVTAAVLSIIGANNMQSLSQNLGWQSDRLLAQLAQGVPYALGVMSVLMGRAIATYYVSRKYQIPMGTPIYLPWLNEFGILSSLNLTPARPLLSSLGVTQQRKIIFDLAAYPHITGILISVFLLVLGNWIFIPSQPPVLDLSFHSSLLIMAIHRGLQMLTPQTTYLSPLTLAGWTGLILNAMQILPWRFWDGQNLCMAMYGYYQTIQIARISRLVIFAIAVVLQPWLRIYSLFLFILPMPRPLILNEGIEINRNRDYLGLTLMAIALLTLLPAPKFLW